MAASKSCLNNLPARIRRFLADHTQGAERLCLALSGGRDSVVLLHLLAGAGLGERLSAIHVHHGLSPRADAWAAFCKALCQRLDLPLTVHRVAVSRAGQGLEAAARQARYAAFAQMDADCLLLAHHQADQAETLLFNLLRGTGVRGAAAMPAERASGKLRILRPLLHTPADAIRTYAAAEGLDWVDDESNADTGFSRNFLRHRVIPVIETRFPGAAGRLADAAARFAEAGRLLDELAESDWHALAVDEALPLSALRTLSAARCKNVLRHRLRHLGWRAPDASRLEEFVRQLRESAPGRRPRLELAEGAMRVERGWLVSEASVG